MANIILLAAAPALLLLVTVISIVVCIYIIAKAHGNVKGLDKKKKGILIFFAFLPLVLLGLSLMFMFSITNKAQNKQLEDIESGVLTLYKVSKPVDAAKTQRINVAVSDIIPQLSFEIFEENLYVDSFKEYGRDVVIKSNEFSQVKDNDVAQIWFFAKKSTPEDMAVAERMDKEKTGYKKTETAIGTIYEVEETKYGNGSGRFLYTLYFKEIDYRMYISVEYRSEEDLSARRSLVVSREYANELYTLITSTLNLQIASPKP